LQHCTLICCTSKLDQKRIIKAIEEGTTEGDKWKQGTEKERRQMRPKKGRGVCTK